MTLQPGCRRAEGRLEALSRPPEPPRIAGKFVPENVALEHVRSLLSAARYPLVRISGRLSCEEVRASLALARQIHALVDGPASMGGCAVPLARRRSGWLAATLGELAGRFNTAVTWTCTPETTHPHFWERVGGDRTSVRSSGLIIIRIEENHTGGVLESKTGFSLPVGNPVAILHRMRSILKNPHRDDPEWHLVEDLLRAQRGLLVFGPELARYGTHAVAELLAFFDAIGGGDRWFIIQLTSEPNDIGVQEVITSLTGVPGSLHFLPSGQGGAEGVEWSPWEWDAETVLRRGEADFVLSLGAPAALLEYSHSPKVVQIGGDLSDVPPQVFIPAGQVGVTHAGTCLRLDGVPVRLEKLVDLEMPGYCDLLDGLRMEVGQ